MEKVLKINVPEGYEVDKEKSTFESIVFRPLPEPRLPESWEELRNIEGCYVNNVCGMEGLKIESPAHTDRNVWPTYEEAEASIALAQLLQLRDRYNKGWRPDWIKGEGEKFCINITMGVIAKTEWYGMQHVLYFKTEELRDKFLSCPEIRKLIKIAKPLL